jgi:hypothetical protein
MTLIVSGCSAGEKVDEALVAKCELLRANLAKLTYTPKFAKVEDAGETFDYLSLSVDGYFSGNVGVKARVAARQLVVDNHPYLADYLSKATGDEYSLDNAVRLAMLEKAIEGTGFTLTLTAAQKQNMKGDFSDPSYKLLQKELFALGLEEDYDSEVPAGCAIVDEFNYKQSLEGDEGYGMEDYLEYKWSDYQYSVEQGLKLVGIANTCEATGEFSYKPCGKKDYISTEDYSSTPATPTNPWERDWRDEDTEIMAKTVWCISKGYNDYNKATDDCK